MKNDLKLNKELMILKYPRSIRLALRLGFFVTQFMHSERNCRFGVGSTSLPSRKRPLVQCPIGPPGHDAHRAPADSEANISGVEEELLKKATTKLASVGGRTIVS